MKSLFCSVGLAAALFTAESLRTEYRSGSQLRVEAADERCGWQLRMEAADDICG